MTASTEFRSTVAIPLHRSAPWLDRIESNIRALAPVATVLVSDVSVEDDALEQLRGRLSDIPSIVWSRRDDVTLGWVPHCNALREQASTEFFMWLAHDDEVEPAWIAEGEAALDQHPEALLAVGTLVSVRAGGKRRARAAVEDYASADAEQRIAAALHRLFVGKQDGLGHAFRGLMRRELAPPLPLVDDRGTKADMYWALTCLGRGAFVSIPANYVKYWHDASASSAWGPAANSPLFRLGLRDALRELPAEARDRLLDEAWSAEAVSLRSQIAELRSRLHTPEVS